MRSQTKSTTVKGKRNISAAVESDSSRTGFPIVCIGMSAGAVVPLEEIFRDIGSNTGAAFLVIHHLRHHPSLLPQILPKRTTMPVEVAAPQLALKPNHIYIIPSGQDIAMTDGHFSLHGNSKTRGWPIVMSLFLKSLSISRHPGIAVVLSGTDSNGAGALKGFRDAGGITIVQDPETAQHPEMPQAAIDTGCADYVLEPGKIAAQIESSAQELTRRIA